MSDHAHHGPSLKQYAAIFASLLVLTTATVALSKTGMGAGVRTFLAFAIASVKALLVALIFMHLKYEKRTIVVFAIAPIILAILFIVAIGPDFDLANPHDRGRLPKAA